MASFTAAGTAYATPRHRHDPVLHLLLDVRLPAHRRPDLGVRRPARARLPARRDRRPHDARTARGCSTRTATAICSRATVPNLVAYDPAFAYELAVIIAGRPAPHVRRSARTSSTTSRSTTRTTRCRRMPEGVAEGILAGPLPLRAVGDLPAERPRVQLLGSGSILRRGAAGAADRSPSATASRPTSGAPPATRSCAARRSSASAGTCCTPAKSRAGALRDARARRQRAAGRRGHRLHEAGARPDRPLGAAGPAAARHRRLRPQRDARRRCAASSRSTPSTRSRRARRAGAARRDLTGMWPPAPCASSASTPRARIPSPASRPSRRRLPGDPECADRSSCSRCSSTLLALSPAAATCGGGGGGGMGGVSSGGLEPEVYRVPWRVLDPKAAPRRAPRGFRCSGSRCRAKRPAARSSSSRAT